MDRHLLLTVGDELNSLYGVRFVSYFFDNKRGTKLTLLYVAPRFDTMDRKEVNVHHEMDQKLSQIYRAKGKAALDKSRELLLARGYTDDQIKTELITKRYGTVKDIVHEARAGLYDAVVLGRRGYVIFEKAFSTSISREIMEHEIDFPIWVCRRPEEGRRNVLLCVDETDPSLRIADHVGFILQQEPQHTVTLFHVDTGKSRNVENILESAREKLVDNQVPLQRVTSKVVRASGIVKAILEETEKGFYAAVAVGRGGSRSKGVLSSWFVGSRSMKLLEVLEKAALWVSK